MGIESYLVEEVEMINDELAWDGVDAQLPESKAKKMLGELSTFPIKKNV